MRRFLRCRGMNWCKCTLGCARAGLHDDVVLSEQGAQGRLRAKPSCILMRQERLVGLVRIG